MHEETQLLMTSYDINRLYSDLIKGPPGPPPRPHLRWHEDTKRWWCGEDGCYEHEPLGVSERGYSIAIGQDEDSMRSRWRDLKIASLLFDPESAPSYLEVRPVHGSGAYAGKAIESMAEYLEHGAESLNQSMRSGEELLPDDKRTVENIASLMVPLEEPQTVYRGIKDALLNSEGSFVQEGDVVDIDSFMSTSRNIDIASEFGYEHGKVITLIELVTLPDTEGITMPNEVFYSEYETVLRNAQQMEVLEVHEDVPSFFDGNMINRYVVARMLPND